MNYIEIIQALQREKITGKDIQEIFEIFSPDVFEIIREKEFKSHRYYHNINEEEFKKRHSLTDSQIEIIREVLDIDELL
jgi:hypothetical protein